MKFAVVCLLLLNMGILVCAFCNWTLLPTYILIMFTDVYSSNN